MLISTGQYLCGGLRTPTKAEVLVAVAKRGSLTNGFATPRPCRGRGTRACGFHTHSESGVSGLPPVASHQHRAAAIRESGARREGLVANFVQLALGTRLNCACMLQRLALKLGPRGLRASYGEEQEARASPLKALRSQRPSLPS